MTVKSEAALAPTTTLDQSPTSFDMYIGGDWVPAASGGRLESLNPFLGRVWATVPDAGVADVEAAVVAAREAFDKGPWSRSTARERAALLRRIGDVLSHNAERLAMIESTDNGKLLKEMLAQMRYMPEWFYYFAGAADKLEGRVLPSDRPNFLAFTRREPLGVVAAIAPWNSPLLLLAWKVAPALAAGCTIVAKPSEHTPVSTLEFARLLHEAGVPSGVFNVITGGPAAGAALVAHTGIDKVAFTGSTNTGIAIAKTAAANLARVSLELGGKSAQIVFEDCDLKAAANGVISGIFAASGQTCMAGSRLLVHRSVHDKLVSMIVDRARTIRLGDPMLAETDMGPMANAPQFDKVVAMIEAAVREGARMDYGGASSEKGGYFVRPTVLTGVRNDMNVAQEEIFGPVLTVIPFDTEDEAVALANDSKYGLAAGVWTLNVMRAHRVSNRLRAGTVWINSYRIVAYNAPFGGFGHSGIGRENGLQAVEEYTETKTVWVETSGATKDPFTIN
jgi:(Z)-2-((N-methylformamido)methylene)-5-hydroxybutyrolactone dehydrogenase